MLTETLLFAGRTVRRFFRSRPNVISVLLFPLVLMFMQLAVASKIVENSVGGSYVDRLAPDIVLATAAFGGTVTALGMFNDIRSGLLARVRTMPVSAVSLLAGRILGDVTRVMLVAVIATAAAYLPGFRFSAGPLAALAFFGVVALFATMITTIGVLAGLVLRGMDAIRAVVSNGALVMFLFSAGFVPVSSYPHAVRPVVQANPISVAGTALIGLSHGGPVLVPLLRTLAWTAGAVLLCLPLAVYRYRRLT